MDSFDAFFWPTLTISNTVSSSKSNTEFKFLVSDELFNLKFVNDIKSFLKSLL